MDVYWVSAGVWVQQFAFDGQFWYLLTPFNIWKLGARSSDGYLIWILFFIFYWVLFWCNVLPTSSKKFYLRVENRWLWILLDFLGNDYLRLPSGRYEYLFWRSQLASSNGKTLWIPIDFKTEINFGSFVLIVLQELSSTFRTLSLICGRKMGEFSLLRQRFWHKDSLST